MEKKDLKEILEMIKEKLERDVEAGCLFGDCPDTCPDQGPIYILPPPRK